MEEKGFYGWLEKFIPKKLRPLASRYRHFIVYVIFGVLTTLINFLIFFTMQAFLPDLILVDNAVAWIGAVIFAFIVNKAFVFEDGDWSAGKVFRQAFSFAAARLFSLGLEEVILYVFVKRLGLNSAVIKIAAQVIVFLSNFLFSKLLVFRKGGSQTKEK